MFYPADDDILGHIFGIVGPGQNGKWLSCPTGVETYEDVYTTLESALDLQPHTLKLQYPLGTPMPRDNTLVSDVMPHLVYLDPSMHDYDAAFAAIATLPDEITITHTPTAAAYLG